MWKHLQAPWMISRLHQFSHFLRYSKLYASIGIFPSFSHGFLCLYRDSLCLYMGIHRVSIGIHRQLTNAFLGFADHTPPGKLEWDDLIEAFDKYEQSNDISEDATVCQTPFSTRWQSILKFELSSYQEHEATPRPFNYPQKTWQKYQQTMD